MGIDPPFLYQRPSDNRWDAQLDRGFNPRAATQTAWQYAQREKELRNQPKKEGPLIDPKEINRHPDSYFIVPYGNLDFKPLGKRTKTAITWTRRVQLGLRILGLIACIGMIVFGVLIIPAGDGSDWIIRIPPALGILHNLYGIWHLSRGPGGRTAPSSASYFIFAAIIDAAMIPFVFFSAWIVRQEWILVNDPAADQAWKTLVDHNGIANIRSIIFLSTWIDAVAIGGISLVSFIMDVYLALKFRKISALPPDMNPFEENLTRHTSKRHKKDKSSVSQTTDAMSSTARDSTASLLAEKGPAVPWTHTRNGSSVSLQSGSAPSSPTKSRPDSGVSFSTPQTNRFSQLSAANGSSASLSNPKRRQGHSRTDSTGAVLPPRSPPGSPQRHSVAQDSLKTAPSSPLRHNDDSHLNVPTREVNASPGAASSVYSDAASWYTDIPADGKSLHSMPSTKVADRTQTSAGISSWLPSKMMPGKAENNWFAIGEVSDDDDEDDERGNRSRSDVPEFRHLREAPSHTVPDTPPKGKYDFSNRSPRPLEMHPPTPPVMRGQQDSRANRMSYPQQQQHHHQQQQGWSPQNQRMSYPQQQQQQQPTGSPYANREARRSRQALQPASSGTPNRGGVAGNGGMRKGEWVEESAFDNGRGVAGQQRRQQQQHQQEEGNLTPGRRSERVISSGYEDERATMSLRNANVKNRQVSGKVAEEGRGGMGWGLGSGMTALRSQMGW